MNSLNIATSILIVILLLGGWVLWKVQKDKSNQFNFEDMLRDDSGKPSAFRLAIFVSLAVSTWVIMHIVLATNNLDTWMFMAYLGIWSGAKVAETAITAYAASKGGNIQPLYQQQNTQVTIAEKDDLDVPNAESKNQDPINTSNVSSNNTARYTPPTR